MIFHNQVQTISTYHVSLAFLVSGQAQQGFNFFSGSLETAAFVADVEIVAEDILGSLNLVSYNCIYMKPYLKA